MRVVPMNCSIVYCFTMGLSAGVGAVLFLEAGVCFVIKALSDTSGFSSDEDFCAMEIVAMRATPVGTASSAARREMKLVRCMVFGCLAELSSRRKHYREPKQSRAEPIDPIVILAFDNSGDL